MFAPPRYHTDRGVPYLRSYDFILLAFSGGKDSLASWLTLKEEAVRQGVDLAGKVEWWHHKIDGREGSNLMDWACTPDYCRKVAAAFGVPIYFSWLQGGFEREMNRNNAPKAATSWEMPSGAIRSAGGEGRRNTRLKFPQVSADLSVRWCSAYLKIDVMAIAIRNQRRFIGKRVLVITGERAQESAARSKYAQFEVHRTDNRDGENADRHVDQWRPVHGLSAVQVWALIQKHGVNPHPVYHVSIGRVSCMFCIFASPDQLATARAIDPTRFAKLPAYERQFGVTIHRGEDFEQRANRGKAAAFTEAQADACRSLTFDQPVFLPADQWAMPSGAFAESCGPV